MVNRAACVRSLGMAVAGSACLAAGVQQAQATLFSFASDVNSNGYTFAGTAGGSGGLGTGTFRVTDFSRPNTFTLLVDDNNGPRPTISVPVEFRADLTATGGQSTVTSGTLYQHSYRVTGTFGFYDMMGNALLTANVGTPGGTGGAGGAILTVPGTQNAWSSAGAIIGSDASAYISYTISSAFVTALGGAATAAQYGLAAGTTTVGTSGLNDFGFTLTNMNTGAVGAVTALDPTTHAPTTTWRAESSFSASTAGVIPAPGTAGLFGLGLLVGIRRRR